MIFLTAHWNNLALINYEIDPRALEKYLPNGTELDYWNNKCYVSLVGFMFNNTKILGIKVPFHIHFEEINLRFYVKRFENGEWKRGVVFIKEIVPKAAIALVANSLFKEHYQCLAMKHSVLEYKESFDFVYQWKTKNKWNTILIETKKELQEIKKDSEAEFITEHYFGYTKKDEITTFEYEVTHPRWEQYEINHYYIDVDFRSVYGAEFAFLENKKPISVLLAKGSKITVENKKKLQLCTPQFQIG